MHSTALIYQIYYREEQKDHLDSAFVPYDNSADKDPLLEFNVFRKLQSAHGEKQPPLWGAVSWKFGSKTGWSGEELYQFIAQHPGYDVYYCNPHPEFEALYPNFWMQGESAHPDFLRLSREIFTYAQLPQELLTTLYPSRAFASTNYFIATPHFWNGYLSFVEEVLEKSLQKVSSEVMALLYSSAADSKGVHANANYLPFIVERLFTIFLTTEFGRSCRGIKYALPAIDKKLNIHLHHLRQMKDFACQHHSLWMASCWLNYRNLYLAQQHDRSWLVKYLLSVTPKKIEFLDFPHLFSDHSVP
ncbi:MAG: hypothetical protein H7832_04920 [Magnetococcus sp. DMHC-6]